MDRYPKDIRYPASGETWRWSSPYDDHSFADYRIEEADGTITYICVRAEGDSGGFEVGDRVTYGVNKNRTAMRYLAAHWELLP